MTTPFEQLDQDYENAIAVIGMAGRFPQSENMAQFWQNIQQGVDCVEQVSDEALEQAGISPEQYNQPNYIKVAATIDDIDKFDANFFGITPKEAEVMDPQARLFLECAWETLEYAGYNALDFDGAIGLFAGTAISNYLFENLMPNREALASIGERQVLMVNEKDFLCGRTAFELDLKGPVSVVQTACSTSLVAVHMACQSLLNGECDIALAGGVSIQMLQKRGYLYQEGGLTSADGHCRAFDQNATGIVSGNGLGLVALKSLEMAMEDGDTIHAVIRGSAINNDGNDKASFAAPSVEGQAAVIGEAQAIAGVEPESISYIEAHGTGTMLGDPIEVSALSQAFEQQTENKQFCALGSLKTNMGHLDVAAGVAGLMKSVMALKHKQLPPSLHFDAPNPHIDFAESPFFVNTELQSWQVDKYPRRAGVSSFGIGGTNAHVILEESMQEKSGKSKQINHLLVLSARSAKALKHQCDNLAKHLEENPETNLADVAFTLLHGRKQFNFCHVVSCQSIEQAILQLKAPFQAIKVSANDTEEKPFVFLYPGGGTQYTGMTASLYQQESVYRDCVDECANILMDIIGHDIRDLMFPDEAAIAEDHKAINETHNMLATIFTVEYGMTKLLQSWGITPSAMVGHSLGEYVAATVAQVFSLSDALRVIVERGRLIDSLPKGNMLAVLMTAKEVEQYTDNETLWLACENSDGTCTIAGSPESTKKLSETFKGKGIEHQLLEGWPGSHSGLMSPILAPFKKVFDGIELSAPTLPYLSNLTGTWITDEQATDPDYWISHLRHTVKFASCSQVLRENPNNIYIEVGPGQTLINLIKRDLPVRHNVVLLNAIAKKTEQVNSYDQARAILAKLWAAGLTEFLDQEYASEQRRRIPLPTYPFERKRYWLNAPQQHGFEQASDNPTFSDIDDESVQPTLSLDDLYERPDLSNDYIAPETPTEEQLTKIWQSLLGVGPIGREDDFFALGGSSLIAIQLTTRIRSTFDVELPLKTLFEIPTVAGQSEAISRQGQAKGVDALTISKHQLTEAIPASYAQQRVWFIQQLDASASAAFHIPAALRLTGELDIDALRKTLDNVIARHDSLRTTFSVRDEQVIQHIAPQASFDLKLEDVSHLDTLAKEVEADVMQSQFLSRSFDLSHGPLIRGLLIKEANNRHILLIVQHHIISDGWSIGVMIDEVSKLYMGYTSNQPVNLPELPIQYADYTVWQQAQMRGSSLEKAQQFWRDYLLDANEVTALPFDRARGTSQSYQGCFVPFTLSSEVTQKLRDLSHQSGTTLFMTLLAGWSILLARLGGDEDIVVGTPVANRQYAEMEQVIGYFVNTIALRTKPEFDMTIRDFLSNVKSDTLDAYAYQDFPFDQVVEAVQPARSVSHTPLFQVMINLHNTPNYQELSLQGLSIDGIGLDQTTTQFDLMLSLTDTGEDIGGDIRFVTALFDESTIEKMTKQFVLIMEAMVNEQDMRIADIDIISSAERDELMSLASKVPSLQSQHLYAHQLVEQQVDQHPDAIALVDQDNEFTYQMLDEQANQIAHMLLAEKIQNGDRIAVCLSRGASTVIALLAIMKVGAIYVPLDPEYPQERLSHMLIDSKPSIVITEQLYVDALSQLDNALLVIDDSEVLWRQQEMARVALSLPNTASAYIIYTSGSTGKPKGVVNTHQGLVNLAHSQINHFGVNTTSKVLQFASPSFDACISEVMMALGAGATLVMANKEHLLPGTPLQETLIKYDITHVTVPPSVLVVWQEDIEIPPMTFILAGEKCPAHLAQRWVEQHTLYNAYGPSENAVCATICALNDTDLSQAPIGKPIDNVDVYVLDKTGQLAPKGAIGEIYLAGSGLAQGYLNQVELTQKSFVQNHFSDDLTAKMYRTGDLGKWRDDGQLVFLGRRDEQIKLRGYRIELAEIEFHLETFSHIKESYVTISEQSLQTKQIVAYLHVEQDVDSTQLRRHLHQHLPEYMVPSLFICLEVFPRTPNGKLDTKALKQISLTQAQTYLQPEGIWQESLADIWQGLLGQERISQDSNFFELGGSSLIASQLLARIEEQFEVELPLTDVFQTPRLDELAEKINLLVAEQCDESELLALEAELDNLSEEEIESLLAETQEP